MAKDDNRKPDFRWYPQCHGVQTPPSPAAQPQAQPMDTSGPPIQREAPPEVTAPLYAAAAPMHPLPQSSHHRSFLQAQACRTRQPSMPCASVPEERAWSASSGPALPSARRICPRQPMEHLDSRAGHVGCCFAPPSCDCR